MNANVNVMEEIETQSRQIADGSHERIKPGDAVHMTAACSPGDCARQGDVYIVVQDSPPAGYIRVDGRKLKAMARQMAHGDTKGSRHVLDSWAGVECWLPQDWGKAGESESLSGPFLRCKEDRVIEHPEHGDIHIAGGLGVLVGYQRNYDKQLRAERRARD
jgi:hypothetical protein